MRTGTWRTVALAAWVLALACDEMPGTPAASAAETVAQMSMPAPDPKTLESSPASTPALEETVAPATPPVKGIAGKPGPSPAAGRLDAPVRVYVFTDYQCPVCRRAVEPLKLLVRSHPDDVVLIVKQSVSPRHALAADAATAALAASRQGKFWPYQDQLFVDQSALARPDLLSLGERTGLNVAAFTRDLDSAPVKAQVQYESALATALGLDSTPTLVINGEVQRGWGSYRGVEGLVERETTRARALAAEGVPPARIAYEATKRSGPDGPRLAAALFETQR
jgi:protein-disulfide isomerase